jgi:hypothetical protein
MPSIRVIVGGAIVCLFVCGLFGGQAAAQTASTEPVGKPIQLLQLTHPGKPEAKPQERSVAKHTSKSPVGPCGDLTFIAGAGGGPVAKASFSVLFREACRAAGVPGSAHGVA